jgi:hypothetical protein
MPQTDDRKTRRFEIAVRADRQSLEALHLELRGLAKRYGLVIEEFRVEKASDEKPSDPGGEATTD